MLAGRPCCISERLEMGSPRMTLLGHDCDVQMVFMVAKWVAILVIGWTLRHGYFAFTLGTPEFTKHSWLDMLDVAGREKCGSRLLGAARP